MEPANDNLTFLKTSQSAAADNHLPAGDGFGLSDKREHLLDRICGFSRSQHEECFAEACDRTSFYLALIVLELGDHEHEGCSAEQQQEDLRSYVVELTKHMQNVQCIREVLRLPALSRPEVREKVDVRLDLTDLDRKLEQLGVLNLDVPDPSLAVLEVFSDRKELAGSLEWLRGDGSQERMRLFAKYVSWSAE